MEDCIFCKIIQKEIPADIVYEDENILAFKDINPVAPVHILIIPKKHISELAVAEQEDAPLLGTIQIAAAKIAEQQGIAENGFRLVNNCRQDGGQVVYHIHYHLLGGRQMRALG